MLTVAVSSRSLFSIEDGHKVFVEEGPDAFDAYMREKEAVPLRRGVAFSLVQKLLALNEDSGASESPRVEVVLLSRNAPEAGLRVMNSVQHYGLNIRRAVFTQGTDRFRYARAMGAHLFLSASAEDVQAAIDNGVAAATMMPHLEGNNGRSGFVKIAFDGDSVLFGDEADAEYQKNGLAGFRQSELANAKVPLGDGPFKAFLKALAELQASYPKGKAPVKLALVTARGMPSHERVFTTLRSWGLSVDEAVFGDGRAKGPMLEAFGADIFFDDTKKNVDSALSHNIVAGHVPFGNGNGIVAEKSAVTA